MKTLRKDQKAKTALFLSSESVCKICLERTNPEDLIHPCRCTGSIHYVHEECLKTWILSNFRKIDEARCELCNQLYLMNFKEASVWNCSKERCYWNARIVLIVKLFFIQLLVWLVVACLTLKLRDGKNILLLCFLLLVSVLAILASCGFAFFLIAQQWTTKRIKDWVILNYESYTDSINLNENQLAIPGLLSPCAVKESNIISKENKERVDTHHGRPSSHSNKLIRIRTKSQDFNCLSEISNRDFMSNL